jgi:hypothetical protein
LVRNLLDLLSYKVISVVADTAISDSVITRMLGTTVANSIDSDKSSLAEAAASEPVLIESADGSDKCGASLSGRIIDLVAATLRAGSIDKVVSKFANAGLLIN